MTAPTNSGPDGAPVDVGASGSESATSGSEPTLFAGHDASHGPDGTDVLLTVWPDGTREVALRPGRDQTWLTWGPPTHLDDASVMHQVVKP